MRRGFERKEKLTLKTFGLTILWSIVGLFLGLATLAFYFILLMVVWSV